MSPGRKLPAPSKTSPPPSRTCRIGQAAAYTGFSAWSLRKAVHGGELKIVRMGNGYRGPWLFDFKDLDAFIESRKACP